MSTQNVLSENLDPKAFADCIVHITVRVWAVPRYCIHAYADDGVLVEEVDAGGGLLLGGSLFNDARTSPNYRSQRVTKLYILQRIRHESLVSTNGK